MNIKREQNLKNKIVSIFKEDEKVFIDGEISWTHLIDFARKLDEDIINKLLQDSETKNHFFKNISGNYNFLFDKFERFINSELLDNSYTSFKNRIGLTVDNRYIKDSKDIVLNFPFKDCYLEGGQTKDEGEEEYFYKDKDGLKSKKRKRKEIFFNEYIAYDEIDALLSKKAFCNFKKYTKNGTEEVKSFNRNENGIIKDNLIIKGNNLLALHSLYSEFKGKVKLIYIDPPYNTKSAANTFSYNNNFNNSTFMVFMKNRLEISKDLLMEDGFIAISIDHYELFYLGVLADEIFGRENRIAIISIETNPGGRSDSKFFATSGEHCLIYSKNINLASINDLKRSEKEIKEYKYKDNKSEYKLTPLKRTGNNSTPDKRPNLNFSIYYNTKTKIIHFDNKDKNSVEILPLGSDGKMRVWRWSKKRILDKLEDLEVMQKNNQYQIYCKDRINYSKKPKTIWYSPDYDASSHGTKLLKSIELSEFKYPKSIKLVKDIISILSNKNDIILDFFGGSATTAHAVLELNKSDNGKRQFIICEQMDYINNITVKRIHKFIDSENFIYFELAQHNEIAKEKIINAKNYEEIKNYFEEICDKFFLRYNLNIKEFEEKIIESEGFKNLDLEKQKEIFIKLLDPNQMYINYSNMEDKKYKLNKKDIELTREFYKND